MNDEEWLEAVDGLFAWHQGATDSGIHDPALTERVRSHFDAAGHAGQARLIMLIAEASCGEDAVSRGYGGEDLYHFLRWIYDEDFAP